MKTRLGLLDLNEDVLRLILDELSPVNLRKVSLVNPYLRYLAQRCLFKDLILWLHDERFLHMFATPTSNLMESPWIPIIPSLVATIIRRPDLAAVVRAFCCSGSGWGTRQEEDDEQETPKLVAREADLEEAVAFVLRQTGLCYRHAWAEAIRSGSPDAYLAVLISELPRLRHLTIREWFFEKSEWLGRVVRSILHDPGSLGPEMTSRFEHVERIQLTHDAAFDFYNAWPKDRSKPNTANVLAFLQAPSLTSADVVFDRPPEPDLAWPANQLPSTQLLTSLCVCGLRERNLAQLLAALPGLKTLEWHFGFDLTVADEYNAPVVDLELILAALERSKHTLTSLELRPHSVQNNVDAEPPAFRLQGTLEGLAAFDQLRTLKVPVVLLTGFEFPPPVTHPKIRQCLPRNLERLTLVANDFGWDVWTNRPWAGECRALHEVGLWVREARSWTPRLRTLGVIVQNYYGEVPDGIQASRDEVEEWAKEVGVVPEIYSSYQPW